jgi:structural hemagglutinin/hemolysin toxin protein RtxA
MYKITFNVPATHVELVKEAMFAAGAGTIGPYRACAWQVLGEGQFMPLEGSEAFIGQKNQLEKVPEYKVEMVCEQQFILEVIAALKFSHPYEQPGYFVVKMEDF